MNIYRPGEGGLLVCNLHVPRVDGKVSMYIGQSGQSGNCGEIKDVSWERD